VLISSHFCITYSCPSTRERKKNIIMLIDVFKSFIRANVLLIAWKSFFANMRFSSFSATFEVKDCAEELLLFHKQFLG